MPCRASGLESLFPTDGTDAALVSRCSKLQEQLAEYRAACLASDRAEARGASDADLEEFHGRLNDLRDGLDASANEVASISPVGLPGLLAYIQTTDMLFVGKNETSPEVVLAKGLVSYLAHSTDWLKWGCRHSTPRPHRGFRAVSSIRRLIAVLVRPSHSRPPRPSWVRRTKERSP